MGVVERKGGDCSRVGGVLCGMVSHFCVFLCFGFVWLWGVGEGGSGALVRSKILRKVSPVLFFFFTHILPPHPFFFGS